MASILLDKQNLKHIAGLGTPVLLLAMLSMMVLPLPPWILDMLFTFNIALSMVVLLVTVYALRPLDFAAFPTVLLIATLLRLALNVASTRVVLLNGHEGTDAAGRVIQAFGEFVVGGDYAVGFVVFAILVIINFVVVTKGAGRISEVTARFTLDAMPGKQMAIDADLNAGLIDQEEARARREQVAQEADFYGAMDGASKFVRGDAIAGILILFINLLGGLVVGAMQHGMAIGDAFRNYSLLTIGDGLVAQIPALVLSTATGIIVTRVSRAEEMGAQVLGQLFSNPRVLFIVAAILAVMGLIPGMPNTVFLLLALVLSAAGWYQWQKQQQSVEVEQEALERTEAPAESRELGWDDVGEVDVLGLEVGYRLIRLVDPGQGGQLLQRIKGVRKKLSGELGFLIHPVHIRDNLDLAPEAYRITLRGVPLAENSVHPDRELAINPGQVFGTVEGIAAKDPAFGLDAVWIHPSQKDQAQALGYTVVDVSTVIATHLSELMKQHAHELLGYEDVQQMLDRLATTSPSLAKDLVPDTLPLATVTRVLQNLLREGVPVRDFRSIAEALLEHGQTTKDVQQLTEQVRASLGRVIVQQAAGNTEPVPLMTLDPSLEQMLLQSVREGSGVGVEPGLMERIQRTLEQWTQEQESRGEPAILVVNPDLRPWMARMLRGQIRGLHVLAYTEIPEHKAVRVIASVGGQPESQATQRAEIS